MCTVSCICVTCEMVETSVTLVSATRGLQLSEKVQGKELRHFSPLEGYKLETSSGEKSPREGTSLKTSVYCYHIYLLIT